MRPRRVGHGKVVNSWTLSGHFRVTASGKYKPHPHLPWEAFFFYHVADVAINDVGPVKRSTEKGNIPPGISDPTWKLHYDLPRGCTFQPVSRPKRTK